MDEKSKLESWIEIIDSGEKRVLDELKTLNLDETTRKLVVLETQANAQSARNYLKQINNCRYPLNEDLSKNREFDEREISESRYLYSRLCGGMQKHLHNFRNIISIVESGNFRPMLITREMLAYTQID